MLHSSRRSLFTVSVTIATHSRAATSLPRIASSSAFLVVSTRRRSGIFPFAGRVPIWPQFTSGLASSVVGAPFWFGWVATAVLMVRLLKGSVGVMLGEFPPLGGLAMPILELGVGQADPSAEFLVLLRGRQPGRLHLLEPGVAVDLDNPGDMLHVRVRCGREGLGGAPRIHQDAEQEQQPQHVGVDRVRVAPEERQFHLARTEIRGDLGPNCDPALPGAGVPVALAMVRRPIEPFLLGPLFLHERPRLHPFGRGVLRLPLGGQGGVEVEWLREGGCDFFERCHERGPFFASGKRSGWWLRTRTRIWMAFCAAVMSKPSRNRSHPSSWLRPKNIWPASGRLIAFPLRAISPAPPPGPAPLA